MSSPGSQQTGAARAKARDPQPLADETPVPAPAADAKPSIAWPPPDGDLESSFGPLEIVDPPIADPEWSATEVDEAWVADPDASLIEPFEVTAPPRRAGIVRRPVLAALVATGAALLGASIAWFTRPVDILSPQPSSPSVSARTARPSEAPSELQEPATTRLPAPVTTIAKSPDIERSRSTRVQPEAGVSAGAREQTPAEPASPGSPARETLEDVPVVAAPPAPLSASNPVALVSTAPVVPNEPAMPMPSTPAVPTSSTAGHSASPPASASAEAMPFAHERTAIQQVLAQYQRAYDALDANAASAIWPSVDAAALERAFAGIKQQNLLFDRCDVKLANDQATAVCPGSLTFVRRVGTSSPEVRRVSWTFALERAPAGWQIARVTAR